MTERPKPKSLVNGPRIDWSPDPRNAFIPPEREAPGGINILRTFA
jgi:hypothetical protein